MRIETVPATPENTLAGDMTPNYPPKGRKFIEAIRGFYQKHGIHFRFSPYVMGPEGLVNPDGSPIRRIVSGERSAIRDYLQRQDAPYAATLDELSSGSQPMDRVCRIAVQIPAHNEERSLYNTLVGWADQEDLDGNPLDPKLFEINVIVNGPNNYKQDGTLDEIDKFHKDYSRIKLNILDVEFSTEKGNIGMARKLMTDLIVKRSLIRGMQEQPLYIETGDSDITGIDPETLAQRIKKLDEAPHLDAVVGTNDFQPEILKHHDLLFFTYRSSQIWARLLQVQRLRADFGNDIFDFHNAVPTNGWNVAFTAEAYALAGGYPASDMQEDYDLGMRFGIMRGFNEDWEGVLNTQTVVKTPMRMHSSPRRNIFALAEKANPYRDFSNGDDHQSIREIDPKKVIKQLPNARISEQNVDAFEEVLQKMHTWTRKVLHAPRDREAIFKQLLVLLGFGKYAYKRIDYGYEILQSSLTKDVSDGEVWLPDCVTDTEGKVRIRNIGNLQNAFDRYRRRNV